MSDDEYEEESVGKDFSEGGGSRRGRAKGLGEGTDMVPRYVSVPSLSSQNEETKVGARRREMKLNDGKMKSSGLSSLPFDPIFLLPGRER